MTTLPQIWNSILTWLGLRGQEPPDGQQQSLGFSTEYDDKTGINLTYVAGNKVANIVTTDSQINVTSDSDNARVQLLQQCANKIWRYKKRIVSRSAGYGKVCLFPYTDDGKTIKFNIVPQSNIIVFHDDGEIATDIAVLSDTVKVKTQSFAKFKRYKLEGNVHTVTEFFANLSNNTILGSTPPPDTGWVALPPFSIANVKRLLFGEIDCPVDPRNNDVFYGVKITDGCDSIIADIKEQFKYLANEYELKKAFIGADSTLFSKDNSGNYILPDSRLFKIMDSGIDDFFEVFDPAIRADSIYLRLKSTYEQLENHIGLSRGIYTSPENVGAYNNQSNIKRSIFDTYAFVTDFRDNVKNGMTDYLYACNVLAEHFGITPQGIDFDMMSVAISWSDAIIDDSTEEFNQYAECVSLGAIDKAELRQWLTGEDIDTAIAKISELTGRTLSEE